METSLRTNSGGFTAPYRSALPRVSTLTEPLSVPSFDDYRYLGARPRSIPSSLGDYGSSDSFSTYQSLAFPDTYNAYTESSMFPPASTPELSIEVLPSICSDRFANSSSYESFSEHNRSLPSMDLHSWRRTVSDLAFYDSPSFRPFVAYDPLREDDSFDPGLVTLDSDTDFHGTPDHGSKHSVDYPSNEHPKYLYHCRDYEIGVCCRGDKCKFIHDPSRRMLCGEELIE